MADGIYVALSGAVAESKRLDVLSHNVANSNTAGYRAQRVTFAEALANASAKTSPQVELSGQVLDASPGALQQTGEALDLAIEGDGFFAVETPQGVRYTRGGSFHLDAEGTVVSADGHAVLDRDGGHLAIPAGTKAIAIGADGTIDADGLRVGQLQVARFEPGALLQEGTLLATQAGASATAIEEGTNAIVSGALERSNFNAVRGMVELIRVSRSYESLTKMIQSYRDLDQATVQKLG
ncbi:flagellar basal-body rod protein FlgF [Myxococcota bacterium]|nr:flagellar basal-body rod protein FlgF [Myxococcota bacterium]